MDLEIDHSDGSLEDTLPTGTNDDALSAAPKTPSRLRWVSRTIFVIVAGTGAVLSWQSTQQRDSLQREFHQLDAAIGRLDVKDADRIYIVALADDLDYSRQRVVRYRVYFPANYAYAHVRHDGFVSIDSCRVKNASSSTKTGGAKPLANEGIVTISIKRAGSSLWISTDRNGTGFGSSFRPFSNIDDLRRFRVKHVGEDGQESFSVDEPIPLLRCYDPNAGDVQESGETYYEGFQIHLVPRTKAEEFEDAVTGETP